MNNADKPISAFSEKESYDLMGHEMHRTINHKGLTKREHFAGLAMQATDLEKYAEEHGHRWAEQVAKDSIMMADELLKQLEATKAD